MFLCAGDCREVLEQYVSCRLLTEVRLCVTGREQGVKAKNLFAFFVQVHVQPLMEEQQESIIKGRFEAKVLEGASAVQRIAAFTRQLRGNVSFEELAKNPLLLNLLVSEYMLHERVGGDGNIYFKGRCVPGQKDYVGSEWDRITQVLKKKSVACVFIPEEDSQYGEHDEDPETPGCCFCESYLYKDPWPGKEKQFILDESNMCIGKALPVMGKKVEALIELQSWNGKKWWVCTVEMVEGAKIKLSFDGLERVKKSGWISIVDINQSGHRKTSQGRYKRRLVAGGMVDGQKRCKSVKTMARGP